jgi:hypothetical protein
LIIVTEDGVEVVKVPSSRSHDECLYPCHGLSELLLWESTSRDKRASVS